jgi:tRNA 2-thiocytidine biosynthesis protein TtcA
MTKIIPRSLQLCIFVFVIVSVAPFLSTISYKSTRHHLMAPEASNNEELSPEAAKLQSRLLKSLRQVSLRYSMLEPNDKIMVCVSGGKDSATLLHLLMHMQNKLASIGTRFDVVAVHLNQMQPGYNGEPLIDWLEELGVEYQIVTEDTYSIVTDKTPENKAYCSLCSRLRRGILYSIAHELGCNKIALGHHGDDAMQTLLLNMIHGGSIKAMPARYFSSSRNVHVLRPLITCIESDIAQFAKEMQFPILPCNLCGSQDDLHRGKAKLLVDAMESMNPNARRNVINSLGNVRPSHLLDENLRDACGLDRVTGGVIDEERAQLIGEVRYDAIKSDEEVPEVVRRETIEDLNIHNPTSFIESLL